MFFRLLTSRSWKLLAESLWLHFQRFCYGKQNACGWACAQKKKILAKMCPISKGYALQRWKHWEALQRRWINKETHQKSVTLISVCNSWQWKNARKLNIMMSVKTLISQKIIFLRIKVVDSRPARPAGRVKKKLLQNPWNFLCIWRRVYIII